MSDDADKSQDRAELEDEIRRRYVTPVSAEYEATGHCLNCGEPVKEGIRWCDVDCRNTMLARVEARKRNGR